jgi:hypothetical protein
MDFYVFILIVFNINWINNWINIKYFGGLRSIISYISRSTKGIKRLSSSERISIEIPDDVSEVLIGILLGDAHISRRSLTSNSRLIYN